jgi:hypothetical protein
MTAKELSKRQRKLRKELNDADRVWLMEEVPDIITERERRAFLELDTAEERGQFIEIFWRNAIPTPNHLSIPFGRNTTVASLTPTNTLPLAFPVARPTAVASTLFGGHPTKSNLILPVLLIVPSSGVVAVRPPIPGSCGAIGI